MLAAAAAAAAAEAAARDAAETEAQQGGDAVLSVAMSAMAGDEVDAAATLGQDPYGHEHQLGGYEAANGMVVEPVAEVGMDHLLQQMVAEQQQVEREQQFREQLAAAAVAEAARLNRPQEHFITIASNGELSLISQVVEGLLASSEYQAHNFREVDSGLFVAFLFTK